MRIHSCCVMLVTVGQVFGASCRPDGPLVPLHEIPEASGIAVSRRSPGVLWSHNDSGEPILFGLDSQGKVKARIRVANAEVEDWEDIAAGPCPAGSCLYIADIGDNRGMRKRITVYRVPEPGLGDASTAPAEAFHATYLDGPHDAEALFVTPDAEVFVVTKSQQALYRFPKPLRAGSSVVLERVSTPDTGAAGGPKKAARITGAAASPDGKWVALRSNASVHFYRLPGLLSGGAPAFRFDLGALQEPQGEGVAWGERGTIYLTGEGGAKSRPGTLARITCAFDGLH
jgi:hypothetical protein